MAFSDTSLGRRVARAPKGLRGMAAMLVSATTISSMNGVVHHLTPTMHAFEIAFFRQVFGLIFLSAVFLRNGLQPLYTRRIRMHLLRAVLNALALLSYFVALSLEPIYKVVALGFTAPMFATLLAVFILRERMGPHRWTALFIGVLGALVILRPGIEVVSFGMLSVLFSNLAWAGALIVIKSLARTETPVTVSVYAALLMVPITAVAAALVWKAPNVEQLYWLVLIGICGSFAQLCLTQAFRDADATLVLPVDFTKIIWASLIGYFFFAEIPDLWSMVGVSIIFSGVFYNAYRERASAP
jgi:drug/metabolite transporter (DMT)-like permease